MQDPTKPPVDQELSLEDFEEQVRAQAGIRPDVWKGMMAQESAGGRKTTSPTGVKGRWQVTEAVAKQYGLDRNNPFHQATAAARYLKDQYDGLKHVKDDDERWLSAVARYYGGPDAVSKDGTVSNVSRDGYSTPAVHIQRVAEKMAEAAKSSPSPTFQSEGAAPPAQTPAKTQPPVARRMKTESEYPVLRAPSDVSTALFDWRSGGTQGILADSARNAEVVKEAQRNQSPQRQRERASAVASGQNALERGASQIYNRAATGAVSMAQGVAELSDLVGEYQPAARLGNAIQGMITGQKPQRLAPQIAPYTQQVQAAIDRDVPIDVNDQSWLTAKIPGAVGSLVPFLAGGALSGGSRAVTGLLGAAGNAGDIGKEFDEAGGDPANRDKAIALAAATGLSEVLGVGKLLAKFGTNQGVMQAAKTVLEEGGQEAFQQWVNNLNAANVGAYDPNRSQTEGVGEAAVLGGLLGGGLSGVSNIAARRAQQPQTDRAPAPIAPAVPRSADTNLNPDEVLTPTTGAQPIIDPVTGLPQAEASNPVTDAKVEDLFAHPLFGRKPNPAAEKAKVKAQEAQAYRQAATEAAAVGDVGRQMDALQEALQRESDPQARLDLKAQLRALEPAPATRKLSGQRAPETAALPEDAADAPTAGLTGDLMSPQEVKAAAPVAGVLGTLQQYKGEVPTLIAAGKFNEAKALIKEMDAFLKVERKKVPPEALSSEYGQRILKDGRELGALRDMLTNRMQAVAAEKAATPVKAPRAATPKTPKGPKVVTPKAESVRKKQEVLQGVAPDQVNLIDNIAAMENRQGGIPPVEPVAGNVLPFEDLAGRAKAKVNKRANMSPVEYLKQASQGEGFRVMDSGEAEGVSAKDAKIVAFTNQGSQYGMNDAAVMLDEGGYFLPDGRRFTDQDVKESDVLDYLKQYGKQPSAGNTGGVDPRIAAEEAAYYEQQAANEGAPTTSTRLPSGLIAESRRPQPIETPRSTPDYRQKALDRINAAELPDNAKQRYRDWLEQGRLTDSDVLNDPDLAPVAQPAPAEQVQEVEMRRTGTDNAPVVEMPKRATPPQPIPEELSRVYGGKITPEQSDAIQRRAKNRASVEIGLGGKFGDMARKSFMSSGGTTELPPLVSHPALREALGLPEMPAYLVEDGRVSKLWQEAAQHVLDGLAEWGGVARSSRAGDDGLGRIEDAIAERINDRTLYEAFGRTVVATDTAQKRLSAVLDRPEVKTAIEAAQAEIADQRARGLKSLALRKSGKALDEALRTASEQALKDFPADAIGSYGKDWSEITKSAIEEFRADIRAERLGPDGSPESWIGRRFRESIGKADGGQARESQAAQGDSEQSAASPAKSPTGRAPAPAQESPRLQAPTEIVEPRVGGYVRKNGRIYEITKYPKEGAVWIQESGSPGAQAITQTEVRKITISDDVAKAEIGEAAKEGQPSQNQPKTSGRKEAPEVEDGTPEIGEGIRRAAEEAKRKLRKPGAVKAEAPAELQQIEHLTPEQIVQVTSQEAADYYQRQIGRQLKDSEKSALKATHERVVRKAWQNGEVIHSDVLAEYPSIDKPILKPTKSSDQPAEADLQQIYRAARSVDHVDADYFQEQVENADANVTWNQIAKGLRNVGASPEDVVKIFDKAGFKHPVANPDITEAEALRREREALDAIGKSEAEESGRQPKGPSQVEYRGSGPNIVQEVKNLVAALSGRSLSKKYKLPADQGKLRAEIEDVARIVKRYAKAREDAGLPIDPELAKSLSDSAQKIATAFQSGDQKGYQNARKAIDDAFVKYGVEAPSFASTRREALKAWEKYQKAQEAAGKPLSKVYAAALIDIEQRLRFANRDGDVQAYQKAKRDLNWLTQKIEAKEDPATLGDRLLTLRAGAHFLNPKFVIRNVLSQPIVWGGDKIDNAVAATISKLAAAVRGKKAVIGVDDFSTLTALNEGRKLALQERRDGKSIDPLYGLHPHAFEGKAGRALEDALFFINRLPDDAFYHGYFTAKLNDLAQRYKGSKDVSLDQLINQAHLESSKLAMRDKNWVSESLKRMQHGLNRLSTFNKSEKVGLGTLIVNYPQYPGSALKRAMEHSPLGLIDVAIEASKPGPFRERNVINALSKTLTGSAFTFGMGTLLGASGILTQGLTDDRRDDRRLREIGYRPYQLNTSALSRWFNGGFQQQRYADGDKLVSIDWAQPFAMLLAAGAATIYAWNREMSKTDKAKETGQAIYDSVASFMSTLGDQSVVKNLTHYKDTYDRAVEFKEDGIAATAKDIADDIVSSNVPVVLNQIRQWHDPVNRSTWAQEADEKGKLVRKEGLSGFLEETFIRRPQSRLPIVAEKGIPGVMRGLPAFPGSRKQTTYTPQPENNSFFNAFVNPSNVSTVRPVDQSDRKLLDSLSQPRKKEEKKRKPIERVKM